MAASETAKVNGATAGLGRHLRRCRVKCGRNGGFGLALGNVLVSNGAAGCGDCGVLDQSSAFGVSVGPGWLSRGLCRWARQLGRVQERDPLTLRWRSAAGVR